MDYTYTNICVYIYTCIITTLAYCKRTCAQTHTCQSSDTVSDFTLRQNRKNYLSLQVDPAYWIPGKGAGESEVIHTSNEALTSTQHV